MLTGQHSKSSTDQAQSQTLCFSMKMEVATDEQKQRDLSQISQDKIDVEIEEDSPDTDREVVKAVDPKNIEIQLSSSGSDSPKTKKIEKKTDSAESRDKKGNIFGLDESGLVTLREMKGSQVLNKRST